MKTFGRILSYLGVALLACILTLTAVTLKPVNPPSKLDELSTLIEDKFIGEADQTAMEDAAAYGMVASLGDRWSHYIPAADFAEYMEQMENAYVGIGVTISGEKKEEGFEILAVTPDGPAQEAGLQEGDILTRVDGCKVGNMTLDEIRELIRGTEGTPVTLSYLRNGTAGSCDVIRKSIQVKVASGQMLSGHVGYVQIVNFSDRCAQETISIIEDLIGKGADSFVFDVRFNPGGYAHELVALLDYLLPEGPVFRTVDYAGRESVENSDAEFLDMPMVVLVNGESYSAAEFFAAALQEYEAAEVVGQPTCGKGYFQSTFQLSDGSAVGLSIGEYFTPQEHNLAGIGITPDRTVPVDEETFRLIYMKKLPPEQDPQIQAALDLLDENR